MLKVFTPHLLPYTSSSAPLTTSAAIVSNRTQATNDTSYERVGRREGGGDRDEYGESDTQVSMGLSSVDDASERSDGSSLVSTPAPFLQPQSLTSVTVYQTSPSHHTLALQSNSNSNSNVNKISPKLTEAAHLRARFHSNSIDTGPSRNSKITDEIEDSKDENFIELKRTPSFLQKLTGKGKSPIKTADKDKKGIFSLFKRKKQLGFADDVISKMISDDGNNSLPNGLSATDGDNK